jgi:cytochrome c
MKRLPISIAAAVCAAATVGEAAANEALAERIGCMQCHHATEPGIGPAYRDIAERYRNDTAARATLMETVAQGGKGNWTEISKGVPMPPYAGRLAPSEIETLVDWILGN